MPFMTYQQPPYGKRLAPSFLPQRPVTTTESPAPDVDYADLIQSVLVVAVDVLKEN